MIRDILTIRSHECRYCVTDDTPFLFCGEPAIVGSSYCEEHHELCHHGYGLQVGVLENMIHGVEHSVVRRPSEAPSKIVPVDEYVRERK
jgi:hypothetical protein